MGVRIMTKDWRKHMKIRHRLKGKEVKGWGLFYTLAWHLGVGHVCSKG